MPHVCGMQLSASVDSIQTRRLLRLQLASFHGITLSPRLMRQPHGFRLSGVSADDEQGDIESRRQQHCSAALTACVRHAAALPCSRTRRSCSAPCRLWRGGTRGRRPTSCRDPPDPRMLRSSRSPRHGLVSSWGWPRPPLGMFRRAATPLACSQLNATKRFIRIAMAAEHFGYERVSMMTPDNKQRDRFVRRLHCECHAVGHVHQPALLGCVWWTHWWAVS